MKILMAKDAEAQLVGSIFKTDARDMDEITQIVKAEDFVADDTKALFAEIVKAWDENRNPADLGAILAQVTKVNDLHDRAGWMAALADCCDSAGVDCTWYAKQVKEASDRRKLMFISETASIMAQSPSNSVAESLGEIDRLTLQMHHSGSDGDCREDFSEMLKAECEAIFENKPQDTGIATDLVALDQLKEGLRAGEFIILAGRPSMGKTALALDITKAVSLIQKRHTLLFSLEMTKTQLVQRLISSASSTPLREIRNRSLIDSDGLERINHMYNELKSGNLVVIHKPGITPAELRAMCRTEMKKRPLELIVIDYLQLIENPGYPTRQEQVGGISRAIKQLALELEIPILCLAQLNRGAAEDRPPSMSDLAECGKIEQDADSVMLIHRPEYYHKGDEAWRTNNPEELNAAYVIVDKNRDGQTGSAKLHFDGRFTRFSNLQGGYA